MAQNDTSLQIINSMTEQKLDSLKNSEGKVPELANQLIMTYDDKSKVETDSLKITIRWY